MNTLAPLVQEDDVRRIVRLLASIVEMEGDHAAKKTALLTGLCELIGAGKWVWMLRVDDQEEAPHFAGYLQGGFSTDQFVKMSAAASHPQVAGIDAPFRELLQREKCHITLRVEDFDKRGLWHSGEVGNLAAQAGVGTFLSSTRPTGENTSSVIALYRSPEEEMFSDRELRIAHILLTEVGWLHTMGWPKKEHIETLPALPKSHMAVLSLLLHGRSRKEIVDHLKLSSHTIDSYIKALYRHFEVNSQPMLMKRFIYGDGHDVLPSHE